MLEQLDGQLELGDILAAMSVTSKRARARVRQSDAIKPDAAAKPRSKKHAKNSVVAALREILTIADEAEARGVTLTLSVDAWHLKHLREEVAKAIAALWLPKSYRTKVPFNLIKALGSTLPPAGYDREAAHPCAQICEAIHETLPPRFSEQWRTSREELRSQAKECVGLRKALRARVSEAKRVALQLLKKNVRVTVDEFGDLTIDPSHNPFADFIVNEPVPGESDMQLIEVVATFGHDATQTLDTLLPASILAMLADDVDPVLTYKGSTAGRSYVDTFSDYTVKSDDAYDLHYRDGIFALVLTRGYGDPSPGERVQRCMVEEGHRYVDSSGEERIAKGHRFTFRTKNEWVTYLGPPEKRKSVSRRKAGRKRPTRRKAKA